MNDRKLMELFLNCPDTVRRICITDNQIKIINLINKNPGSCMRAKELMYIKGTTIQNASTQLVKLWKVGYLTRTEVVQESGGLEYVYESVISKDEVYLDTKGPGHCNKHGGYGLL